MRTFILVLFLFLILGCAKNLGEDKMADVVLIISQRGYQPTEFLDTKKEIEDAGLTVKIASVTTNTATSSNNSTYQPDLAIKDIKVNNFKALVIIGGPGSTSLLTNNDLLNLIKKFNSEKKIVAAICFSPRILAETGILKGKKATVFPSEDLIKALRQKGAEYTDKDVVKDGNIITGNGPDAASEFGKTIAKTLK